MTSLVADGFATKRRFCVTAALLRVSVNFFANRQSVRRWYMHAGSSYMFVFTQYWERPLLTQYGKQGMVFLRLFLVQYVVKYKRPVCLEKSLLRPLDVQMEGGGNRDWGLGGVKRGL